jgi:hypothetical protein
MATLNGLAGLHICQNRFRVLIDAFDGLREVFQAGLVEDLVQQGENAIGELPEDVVGNRLGSKSCLLLHQRFRCNLGAPGPLS